MLSRYLSVILVTLSVLVLLTCSPKRAEKKKQLYGYTIEEDGVRWAGERVPGADPETFEWIEIDGVKTAWGRDQYNGYFRNVEAPGSHGPSFVAFAENECVAKDNVHVYYGRRRTKTGKWFMNSESKWKESMKRLARSIEIIEEADPASFKFLNSILWVDKDTVFRDRVVIEGADPATFRLLPIASRTSSSWYADDEHVYLSASFVPHADPKTFRLDLKTYDLMDDNYVYHGRQRYEAVVDGEVVPAKSATWRVAGNEFYKTDGVFVFKSQGDAIPDADPRTFEALGKGFAKDAERVWFSCNLISGIDATSLQRDAEGVLRDKHGIVGPDRHPRTKRRQR